MRSEKLRVFDLIEVGSLKALLVEKWNAPPHRYFLAWRSLGDFRHVMGLPVVQEFATFSSPILFGPVPLLGKIYNAGITVGHNRGPDMDIDMGWPPLCIGVEDTSSVLPENWETELLEGIKTPKENGNAQEIDGYLIQTIEIGQTSVYATSAPLLPRQLLRVCQISKLPFSIAFASGNRITRQKDAAPVQLQAVSESQLQKLIAGFESQQ